MNATVARIVEIMFQNTKMTSEVQAIKDEVMINCQERYEDMRARGMNEDEAIAAVIDSLHGMEEVIAEYPKKTDNAFVQDDEDDDSDKDLVYDPACVDRIRLLLTSECVSFESSMDDQIHVYYNSEELTNMNVSASAGEMLIENKFVNVRTEQPVNHSGTLSGLLHNVINMIGNIQVNFNSCDGDVTIGLPDSKAFRVEVHTTSGDVEMCDVRLTEAFIECTSGDVTISDTVQTNSIRVNSASGDVEIQGDMNDLKAQTVSGDLSFSGKCPEVNISTISGDAELRGAIVNAHMKSVSGDIDFEQLDDSLRNVSFTTTSGDLSARLPHSLQGQVAVYMQSVSGDCRNRFGEHVGAPVAVVNMKSVSGDLLIH